MGSGAEDCGRLFQMLEETFALVSGSWLSVIKEDSRSLSNEGL